MEEPRDKLPAPDSAEESLESAPAAIPEEAEVIEIVDDHVEPTAPAPAPAAPTPVRAGVPLPQETLDQLRNLREQLDRKDKQIEQIMEAYRTTKAETEKLRGRISKTEKRRFEQSKGDFIARFVEVLDNLDRAIDSIEQSFDADSVLQGIMLVRSRLVQLLKTEGLEKIFVRGQPFDPMHSEAAEMEVVLDEDSDGVVVKELQPGYMLKGSLLRAARVVVGQFGTQEMSQESPSPGVESAPTSGGAVPVGSERAPAKATEDEASNVENPPEEGWETDEGGHELQFSEDGLDFSKE